MSTLRNLLRRSRDESGAAMITTLLVTAVLAGLGMAILDVSLNNLQNAGRDRLGGTALGTSESGVAQAIEYIKSNGIAGLNCSPSCTSNAWGNSTSPKTVSLPNGRQYKVWIEAIQAYNPPLYKNGTYKIHSLGTAGAGPGSRSVEVTVTAKPFSFPIGVYADSFADAGDGSVHTQHLFSKGCIINRNAIEFLSTSTDPQTGETVTNDPFYGYPPAAHSADYITEKNQASSCNNSNSIHKTDKCNATYPADQDLAGDNVTSTACASVVIGGVTSKFDTDELNKVFGYTARGLTNSQYAALKTKAQSQGNFWTDATLGSFVQPCATTATCPAGKSATPNGVLYFKVSAGTVISNELKKIATSDFVRSTCGSQSLVIVVEGGSLHLNSNTEVTAAVFVPDGTLRFNGGATIEGTVFAKNIDKFNGTADFFLDPCFLRNFPGGLIDVTPTHFREVDR